MLLHSGNSDLEMLEIFEMLGPKLRNVEIPNVETVTLLSKQAVAPHQHDLHVLLLQSGMVGSAHAHVPLRLCQFRHRLRPWTFGRRGRVGDLAHRVESRGCRREGSSH